jgi:hypothetical protein
MDVCTNAEDLAIVCDAGFSDEVETCRILDPWAWGIARCLVENTGVSADCASCYGATIRCIFVNCGADCGTAPHSQACDDCQAFYGCDTLHANRTSDLANACPLGGTMFYVRSFELRP